MAAKFRHLRKLINEYQSTAESLLNRNGTRASDQCWRCLYLRELRGLFGAQPQVLPTTLELTNFEKRASELERADREEPAPAAYAPGDIIDLVDAEIMHGVAGLCFIVRRSYSPESAAVSLIKQHRQMLAKCETLWKGDTSWYAPFRDQRQQKVQGLADAVAGEEKPDAQAGKGSLRDRSAPTPHSARRQQHSRPR
jgi:hypothetical protein